MSTATTSTLGIPIGPLDIIMMGGYLILPTTVNGQETPIAAVFTFVQRMINLSNSMTVTAAEAADTNLSTLDDSH